MRHHPDSIREYAQFRANVTRTRIVADSAAQRRRDSAQDRADKRAERNEQSALRRLAREGR